MILADTSVWVQHLRVGMPGFEKALREGAIYTHWVVIGELAVGNLPRRIRFLADLRTIRRARDGTSEECLEFLETHKLFDRGLGWNDIQLLVAAHLTRCLLWSLDTRLAAIAAEHGVGHPAP